MTEKSLIQSPFEILKFQVAVSGDLKKDLLSVANIKIRVGSEQRHTVAEGEGPVNALDKALRKALLPFYPSLKKVRVINYQVFILNEEDSERGKGTASRVNVVIVFSDGRRKWANQRESNDIIEASLQVLVDSFRQVILKSSMEEVSKNKPAEY